MRTLHIVALATIVVPLITGAAGYFMYVLDVNATLRENAARYEANVQTIEAANKTTVDALNELRFSYDENLSNYSQAIDEFQIIRSQAEEVGQRLEEHDIGALAAKHPEMIERIINSASEDALRCFEILSGSDFTEAERNADDAQEFNSECPWLFDAVKGDAQ